MKFYTREAEIELLRKIEKNTTQSAQMAMVFGRRRVGNTTL
ncbi:MAG TPA: hypothetical protein PLC76_04685 [Saprospiraceae bacterium]|nr:hypothetical protein [Saprospiraceae bacterium]HRP83999.1 hypothetical protein [Saprospiraceae bacterium]